MAPDSQTCLPGIPIHLHADLHLLYLGKKLKTIHKHLPTSPPEHAQPTVLLLQPKVFAALSTEPTRSKPAKNTHMHILTPWNCSLGRNELQLLRNLRHITHDTTLFRRLLLLFHSKGKHHQIWWRKILQLLSSCCEGSIPDCSLLPTSAQGPYIKQGRICL